MPRDSALPTKYGRLGSHVDSDVLMHEHQRQMLVRQIANYCRERIGVFDSVMMGDTQRRQNDCTLRSREYQFRNGVVFSVFFSTDYKTTVAKREEITRRLNRLAEEIVELPLPSGMASVV